MRLAWPPRGERSTRGEAATLIVRVEGAFAIELQHQAAVVVERVNAHVGWRCVERWRCGRRRSSRGDQPASPCRRPTPAAVARAGAVTATVGNADLREALTRLGSRVLGGNP